LIRLHGKDAALNYKYTIESLSIEMTVQHDCTQS